MSKFRLNSWIDEESADEVLIVESTCMSAVLKRSYNSHGEMKIEVGYRDVAMMIKNIKGKFGLDEIKSNLIKIKNEFETKDFRAIDVFSGMICSEIDEILNFINFLKTE